jgi:hypothetical protein
VDTSPNRESEPQKRRSLRIVQAVPLTVTGVDALGRPFQERTSTLIINCHGCRYQSKHYVLKNMWVSFEVPHPEAGHEPRNFRGRVTWIQRPRTVRELFQIAVELETAGNVWGIAFPPSDWFPIPDASSGEIPAPAQSAEEDWSVPTIDRPLPPMNLPREQDTAPLESPSEDNIRVMPVQPGSAGPGSADSSVLLARQMSRLLNEARQQLQEAVKENTTRAVAAETRPLLVALQNQMQAAAEKTVHATISAEHEQILRESRARLAEAREVELESMAAEWSAGADERLRTAAQRLEAEIATLERTHQSGLDQRVKEQLEQSLSAIQRAGGAFAIEIQSAEAHLDESRQSAQAATSIEIRRLQEMAERAVADARARLTNLEQVTSQLREQISAATQEAQLGWRGRLETEIASAGVRWDLRVESSIENAARAVADRLAHSSEGVTQEFEQRIARRIEELGQQVTQAAAAAEASLARLREAIEAESSRAQSAIGDLRDAAARAEDHAAALEALKHASTDELARRGEALVEANSAEMNRRADGAASSMATRLEFALETAAQELLQRLAAEFEQRLAPELDRARGAIDELQSNSQTFEETLQTHQDSLREAAERSLQEAIARTRDGLRELEEEFHMIGRESQAKWLAELEAKTTDTTHAAFESMFKTADWYEKKVQTQMQSSMEKGLEQAGEELRKKAGEMSGAFATELDHYSRSYVGHSKDQIEEILREASERVRDNAQEAANGVAASFGERAREIASEQEAGFAASVQAAAEQTAARIHSDAAESLAKLDAAQRDADTQFREGLAAQTRESVSAARTMLDAEAAALAESWESARAERSEQGRQDLARLGETAIEEYKHRLENASNSWLVTSVANLQQQSGELIERLANEAEARVRAACSSVFTEIGAALRQRLLGSNAAPPAPENS